MEKDLESDRVRPGSAEDPPYSLDAGRLYRRYQPGPYQAQQAAARRRERNGIGGLEGEIRAEDEAALVTWASERLERPVAIPDLSGSGYRFMGGRVVATPHGAAVLLMYDDDHGARLVLLMRPMAIDRDVPMAPHDNGRVSGFVWAEKGIGYSLVGPLAPAQLHPIANEARRQLGRSI